MAADEATDADPDSVGGGRVGDDDPTQHAREDALTQPSRESAQTVPSRENAPTQPSAPDSPAWATVHPSTLVTSTDDLLEGPLPCVLCRPRADGQTTLLVGDKFWVCEQALKVTSSTGSRFYKAVEHTVMPAPPHIERPVLIKYIPLSDHPLRGRPLSDHDGEVRTAYELADGHAVCLHDAFAVVCEGPRDNRQDNPQDAEVKVRGLALVMDLVTGPTLEASFKTHKVVWTLPMLREIVRQLTPVLVALHANHITHGDIHGGNLMLAEHIDPSDPLRFHLYLLDFGQAKKHTPDAFTVQGDIYGICQTLLMLTNDGKTLPKSVRDVVSAAKSGAYHTLEDFTGTFLAAVDALLGGEAPPADPTLVRPPRERIPNAIEAPETIPYDPPHPLDEPPAAPHYAPPQPATVGRIGRWAAGVMVAGIIFLALAHTQVQPTAAQGVGLSVSGRRVVLIDLSNGDLLHAYPRYPAEVHAYSPDGRYLAAERVVLDRRTGELVRRFDHAPTPVALAFSPDGALLLLHDGADVSVWDIKTGQRVRTLTGLSVEDLPRIFTPEGRALVQRQLRAALALP